MTKENFIKTYGDEPMGATKNRNTHTTEYLFILKKRV